MAFQPRTGWLVITCTDCGRQEEVMSQSLSGQTGMCSRCYWIAEGEMDRDGNWLGKYAGGKDGGH